MPICYSERDLSLIHISLSERGVAYQLVPHCCHVVYSAKGRQSSLLTDKQIDRISLPLEMKMVPARSDLLFVNNHLLWIVESRPAELPVIFPVAPVEGVLEPHVRVCGKAVRARRNTHL